MNKENKEKVKSNVCPICGRPLHIKPNPLLFSTLYCIFHAKIYEKEEKEFNQALKEYIQEIKEEGKDYDFEKFIFFGDINFNKDLNIAVFKNAKFENATFEGVAVFCKATFKGDANFMGATFKGNADFMEATFEGNADFHKASFKDEADFLKATFEGEAGFRFATFKYEAGFWDVTFEDEADFIEATFKGDASFGGTTFKGKASFLHATFKYEAVFLDAIFKGKAWFLNAIFESKALFSSVIFESKAHFSSITFKGDTDFNGATFKEGGSFFKTTFVGKTYFLFATFKDDAGFLDVNLENNISFYYASLPAGKTLSFKVKNMSNISFKQTILENVYLKFDLEKDVFIDFTDAMLKNTIIEKDEIDGHILQEQEKIFSEAREVYLLLKNNFHSIGRYNDESWAFKKEKDMERKSYFHFKALHKWLWSCFLNGIYGYGEKPERVIVSAIVIIIIYAFVFMNYGIVADSQLGALPKYNILKELFMGIRYGDLLIRLKDISSEQIKNCLYFSTVTFTTLGLGDFRPVEGWGRIFVGTEAFIGAFMMALLVYTFARRTGGR